VATFATNTDFTIRLVRTDRAPEFATAEARAIYNEFGIRHLRTVAHSSWENGFAERVIQTINKIASAQLVHAKFTPEEYHTLYLQSLRHGVDVYNLCPHSGLDYLCPNEIWTGTKPHINELRTFGSTAYEYLEAKLRPDGKRINFLPAKSGHLHYILNIKEYYNIFQFYCEKKSVREKWSTCK
jgi:hypothetical protein